MAAPMVFGVDDELLWDALEKEMSNAVPEQPAVDIVNLLKRSLREVVWSAEVLERFLDECAPWHLCHFDSLFKMQTHVSFWLPL